MSKRVSSTYRPRTAYKGLHASRNFLWKPAKGRPKQSSEARKPEPIKESI